MEVSVLPESDTLSDNIPCLAYGSSHFQQEWPYCLATTQRSYRCKNKLWKTWREEGLLVTGCRGKVVPSSQSNYSSKDMLWRKPPEQCSRGVCGKDIFFRTEVGINPKTHGHLQGRSLHLCWSPQALLTTSEDLAPREQISSRTERGPVTCRLQVPTHISLNCPQRGIKLMCPDV